MDALERKAFVAKRPGGQVAYWTRGHGPTVLMLPGFARGAADFDNLAASLAANGYRAVQPHPRGLAGSAGPMTGVTFADLAADVAAAIEDSGERPVVVIGHALGNRIARMLAAKRPDLVKAVVLLAAGGKVPPRPAAANARARAIDPALSARDRLEATRVAYCAPGNDPSPWFNGWQLSVAGMQEHAVNTAKLEEWWTAGEKVPLLVVQGRQDVFAPPENGYRLKAEVGDRAQLVDIDNAGHALLLEQPHAIHAAVLSFLKRVAPGGVTDRE